MDNWLVTPCTYPDFIEKGMAAFNRMREQVDRDLWSYPDKAHRVYLDGIRVRRTNEDLRSKLVAK